jgi:hypothetical protein
MLLHLVVGIFRNGDDDAAFEAIKSRGYRIWFLGGKDKVLLMTNKKSLVEVTDGQLSKAVGCRQRISKSLGASGVKLVKEALAQGGKSLADATEEEVIAVIESFDSQRSQTHRLVSRRNHISKSLGAGGVKLVEEALARGGKSLADATEEEVIAVIESFDSQRSQTRRRNRISQLLGAGGVQQVEEALARGGKSLANATEEEVNAVIDSFDSQRSQTHRLKWFTWSRWREAGRGGSGSGR